MEISTPRLHLRPFVLTDAPALCDLRSNASAILKAWAANAEDLPAPLDVEQARIRRAQKQAGLGTYSLGLFLQADNTLTGMLQCRRIKAMTTTYELGYWLGEAHQGHGYMREAVQALTGHLFIRLGAMGIYISTYANNARSIRVAQSLEFRELGTLSAPSSPRIRLFTHTPQSWQTFTTRT